MSRSGRSAPPRHLAGAPRPARPEPLPPAEPIDDDPQALLDAPRVPGHRLAFAVASTFAALPILVVDNLPAAADDAPAETVVELEVAGPDAPVELPATTTTAPPTTTAPATIAPTTTAAPSTTVAATVVPQTTAAPVTTTPTTTIPPTTTTAPPEPAAAPAPTGNQESGQATWYRQPPRYAPGGCAHKTLPFGTVVTITAHADGATATCTVNDRGPYPPGRIIDLDDDVYVQLAPLSTGVIDVTITW